MAKAEPPPLYSIEQLLKVHRAMSPRALDGKSFVYLSDEPGTSQLFVKQGEKPRQLTSFPDRVSNFRVAPGGKDNTPLWLTLLCGIGGVLLGLAVYTAFGGDGSPGVDWTRWAVSVALAAVLVVVASSLTGRNTVGTRR